MRFLPGVLFGAVLGAAAMGIYSGIGVDVAIATVARQYAVLALLGGASLLALFFLYVFRNLIAQLVFGKATRELEDLVQDVSDSIDDLAEHRYSDLRTRLTDMSKSIAATLTLWATRATLTRVMLGLFIASAGAFGTYVLIQQNQLIASQTTTLEAQSSLAQTQVDLTTAQNELLADQTQIAMIASHLQTAARRSIYTPQVTEIVSEIGQLQERFLALGNTNPPLPFESADEERRFNYFNDYWVLILPEETVQKIRRLLPLLTPYVVIDVAGIYSDDLLDLDNVTLRYVSPERGIILKALLDHGVSLQDFVNYENSAFGDDFSFADMRNYRNVVWSDEETFPCFSADEDSNRFPPFFDRSTGQYERPGDERRGPNYIDLSGLFLDSADFSGAALENVRFSFALFNETFDHWEPVYFVNSIVNIDESGSENNRLPPLYLNRSTAHFWTSSEESLISTIDRIFVDYACDGSLNFNRYNRGYVSDLLGKFSFGGDINDPRPTDWTSLITESLSFGDDPMPSITRIEGVEETTQYGETVFTPSLVVFEAEQ